ncbi:hypothetical protein K450DRAFT_242973 [Umbelopsis ramanniana AG]|uniref:Uncharacterized protein n=1 Tax=Umbelopsis ramanniana AG TaxID=1314678 RepID=A0AAD5E931_UMBRA|nr:uncharacterized protein K450DRAFT_242973 [Umbelopsis ramanniana AG]KAI8579144.1 hypothetical protein K450DRAFT_242973 [Umbelopsis ramanniana AG]
MIAVILEILIALLFPPAAVAMITGCGPDLCINICLTILGYLPGHVHAFWIIWRKYDAEERAGYHRGFPGRNYGSLERQPQPRQQQANYQAPPPPQQQNPVAPPPQNQPVYDNKPPAYSKN